MNAQLSLRMSVTCAALLTVLSCSDSNPVGPSLGNYYSSATLDSYAATGRADLFWTASTHKPYEELGGLPDGPPVAQVTVLRSSIGPDRGYAAVAIRNGGGPDSFTVSQLVDGTTYWFKIAAYDRHHTLIVSSRPVMLVPGRRVTPVGSMAITPKGRLSWSPAGDSIAYIEDVGYDVGEARFIDVATLSSQPMGLAGPPNGDIFDAEWSPGGNQIAYTHTPTRTAGWIDYRVRVADRRDGSERDVSEGRVDFDGAWADSNRIFYCRGTYDPPNIYQIWRADLSPVTQLQAITSDQRRKFHPSVRPSDEIIVFEGENSEAYVHSLYLLNPATGLMTGLTSEPWCSDKAPSWSPDGVHVLFISDRCGHPEIWSIHTATKSLRQVTRGERGTKKRYARLSTDSARLAVVDGDSWAGHPAQLQIYEFADLVP